jgi:hypothetical protein
MFEIVRSISCNDGTKKFIEELKQISSLKPNVYEQLFMVFIWVDKIKQKMKKVFIFIAKVSQTTLAQKFFGQTDFFNTRKFFDKKFSDKDSIFHSFGVETCFFRHKKFSDISNKTCFVRKFSV